MKGWGLDRGGGIPAHPQSNRGILHEKTFFSIEFCLLLFAEELSDGSIWDAMVGLLQWIALGCKFGMNLADLSGQFEQDSFRHLFFQRFDIDLEDVDAVMGGKYRFQRTIGIEVFDLDIISDLDADPTKTARLLPVEIHFSIRLAHGGFFQGIAALEWSQVFAQLFDIAGKRFEEIDP